MAHLLPPFPRFIFSIVEPISTTAGFCYAVFRPNNFVAEQYPDTAIKSLSNSQLMVSYELGNTYFILSMAGVAIFTGATDIKVINRYLIALLLGDIGHFYLEWLVLGTDGFFNIFSWNLLRSFNIGFTMFLMFTRLAYFAGLFGDIPKINKTPIKKN